MTRPAEELLPCGRSSDELLAQVAGAQDAPVDPHQVSCPHCQAALTELRRLWAPVRQLADEPVAAPRSLVTTVVRQVRAATPQGWHAVAPGERGTTRVAARVIATLAQLAAARVPGVQVAHGRTPERPPAAAGTLVELALTAEYGAHLHELAEDVRAAVLADLSAFAGLRDVQVDVTVDDVVS